MLSLLVGDMAAIRGADSIKVRLLAPFAGAFLGERPDRPPRGSCRAFGSRAVPTLRRHGYVSSARCGTPVSSIRYTSATRSVAAIDGWAIPPRLEGAANAEVGQVLQDRPR